MDSSGILYIEDFEGILYGRGGHVKTFCPFCHESRSNKSDRSLSIDTKSLGYRCHYCGAKGYLKSRMQETLANIDKRFKPMKKEYRLPQKQPNIQGKFEPSFLEYFNKRGISEGTLLDMKVTKETEFIPQDNAKRGVIAFNYYLNGELVNVKYRTRDKHFKLISGAQLIPYNIDSIGDEAYSSGEERACIVTEGECFDENAQVLTNSGEWKKINDLDGKELVAQWCDGSITFERPIAIVKKYYKGDLVEYTNSRNNFYSLTTPLHNMVVCRNGYCKKVHAEEISSQINVPRNGYSDGKGIPMSDDMLRLLVAISADFTIREKGDLCAGLKKERKITRIKQLLESNNIRYTINKSSSREGLFNIYIYRRQLVAHKEFPFEWLYLASKHQIGVILEELVFWDGNRVPNRSMTEYSTKLYHNAVWVQTLCHLGGMTSKITKRKSDFGEWYKVTMIHKDYSSISAKQRTKKPYDGYVYCCTMPYGTLLIRQNELITVSGNCDTLTYVECGFKHVISVPNGANSNLEWLDDFVDSHFDKMTAIYISVDNDRKGIEARNELVRRFGADVCKIVDYPKPCKDINEVLVQYGREKVKECVANAQDVKVSGIQGIYDIESGLDDLFYNGLKKGAVIGEENTDKILSFNTGMLTIVTGVPSHGKALSLDTPLPTPDGWTTMGDVKVGDKLYDDKGNICTVTYATPIQYNRNCYKIVFSDHSEIICDEEHLWVTRDDKARRSESNYRKRLARNGTADIQPRGTDQSYKRTFPKERTTREIMDTLYVEDGKRCNHAVSVQGAIRGTKRNVPLHPYILGVWLADGTVGLGSITTGDVEVVRRIQSLGFKTTKYKYKYSYGILGLSSILEKMGILYEKRIPRDYLRLHFNGRLELLKGLMDSDGYCSKDGSCSYSSSRKGLADDVYELVVSMGLKATVTSKIAKIYGVEKKRNYNISFRPNFNCFTLNRKSERIRDKYADDVNWRYIRKIEKVDSVPVKCIQVDSPSHMYLCGKSMIPTHNTFMLNYILVRLNIIHDWKVAFFSPEFYPTELHVSQIIETLGGSRFNHDNYNQMEYEVLKEYVSKNFFWIDPDDTDIGSVLDRAKYLIKKKGIKAFVIDPFNALTDKERKSQKQDEYISDFLQKVRWFGRKYNVAMFVVMHPVKMQKLESGLYPVCDLYDCKGASEIYDKADVGLTVWRNELENYGELHVTKMKFRHLGEKGHSTFRFNYNNGRYVEVRTDLKGNPIDNIEDTKWDNSNYVITKTKNLQIQQTFQDEQTDYGMPFEAPEYSQAAPF